MASVATRRTAPAAMALALAVAVSASLAADDSEASAAAFKRMAQVLRHPRCLNCHTVTDFPRQGDDRHRHQQLVVRGSTGHGAPTVRCARCHQAANSVDGRVPGAAGWHLAPLSMGWENLATDRELCQALKDTSRNGNREAVGIVEHLANDPLVQWAWAPGARVPPPITQVEFHALARRWLETGAACPRD